MPDKLRNIEQIMNDIRHLIAWEVEWRVRDALTKPSDQKTDNLCQGEKPPYAPSVQKKLE